MTAAARLGSLAALITLLSQSAGAQDGSSVLVRHDFETSESGWSAIGGSGKTTLTTAPDWVHSGKQALKFDYTIGQGGMDVLLLAVADGAPAGTKSFSFWVRSSTMAPLFVVLQERDGGRYVSAVCVPAAKWQKVELSPADFAQSTEPDDPADPNGKLDIDQVVACGIADMGQMVAQGGEATMAMLGIKPGPRSFAIDDFEISSAALPAPASPSGEVLLEAFARPQIGWLVTGVVKPELVSGKPLDGKGLSLSYTLEPNKAPGCVRFIPKGALGGTEKLSLQLASARPTTLLVQLEESTGGKYNAAVSLDGDKKSQDVTVVFSEFQRADDSKDTNDRLDLALVKQIVLIDAAFLSGGPGENTLWIGKLRAIKAK